MAKLAIARDTDFYHTPILVDAASGKRVRFEAREVLGKGWTVMTVTGSLSQGRTMERAEGFEATDHYTMHEAQAAAESLTRDMFRALQAEKVAELSASGAPAEVPLDPDKAVALRAIDAQAEKLKGAWRDTARDATDAQNTLHDAEESLTKLRHLVEQKAASSAVHQAFMDLQALGLPIEEIGVALNLAGAVEPQPEEPADQIRGFVGKKPPAPEQGKAKAKPLAVGEDGISRADAGPKADTAVPASESSPTLPATLLNGKFIRNQKGEYHRENEEKVSFVDQESSIRFIDKQMDTFQACIELAASKGWTGIEVTGSERFRAEAWYHASLAGLAVVGYEPNEKDKVRLETALAAREGKVSKTELTASQNAAEAVAKMKGNLQTVDKTMGRYTGDIVHQTAHHVVQDIGKGKTAVHEKRVLSTAELNKAVEGKVPLTLEYRKGVVYSKAKVPETGKELSR